MKIRNRVVGVLAALGLATTFALVAPAEVVPVERAAAATMYVKHTPVSDGVARRMLFRDSSGFNFYLYEGESYPMSSGGRQAWIPGGCEVSKDGHLFGSAIYRTGFWKGFDWQVSTADFRPWCP
jgi:hypothetical protein